MQSIDDFLTTNKVSFETLIRCVNYWTALSKDDIDAIMELYQEGALNKYGGWY